MRKLFGLVAVLTLIAGCSMHTRYTFDVKLHEFLGNLSEGSLDLPTYASFEIYFPDDDDGDYKTPDTDGVQVSNPVPADRYIEKASFTANITIEETSGKNLEFVAEVYVGDPDIKDLYHGQGTKIGEGSLTLGPEETGTFALDLELVSGDDGFELVTGGDFRFGILIRGSGQSFTYKVETMNFRLTTRPIGEILRP